VSACVLKYTVPGVPDTYQGNELPAFVLVDPDNRRIPDLHAHAQMLDALAREIEAASLPQVARGLLESWRDGRLKLFVTWRLLALRAANPALFDAGSYLPLVAEGSQAAHVGAFARVAAGGTLIVVASRWAATLMRGDVAPPVGQVWNDARIQLPAEVPVGEYIDVFTGRTLLVGASTDAGRTLKAHDLFSSLPVCVLMTGGVMPAVQTAAANGP
jgi:(1->4)-alpha-D-glucan 1-alpha-D-glucosylmutase